MQEYPIPELTSAQLSILVAEDDDLSFTITQALIERITGTRPDRAENGLVAFEKVRDGDYDLVLMDHLMPKENGIEATRRIRNEIDDWRQPIIVGLSGSTTPMDLIAFRKVGLDQFLSKPLRLVNLSEMLLQVAREGKSMITMPTEEFSGLYAFS